MKKTGDQGKKGNINTVSTKGKVKKFRAGENGSPRNERKTPTRPLPCRWGSPVAKEQDSQSEGIAGGGVDEP